jgi:hypothetical protein
MKKIMFNDRFGLTQAVLDGRKTITRRAVPEELLECITWYAQGDEADLIYRLIANSTYRVGEVVAIAQSYRDAYLNSGSIYKIGLLGRTAGWTNKMFVCADDMPHHIKITNIRVEHLQDISDEDCLREGIRKWDKDGNPLGPSYDFVNSPHGYATPREAFAALIDKVSGKGTWNSNPMVWVYEFELVD